MAIPHVDVKAQYAPLLAELTERIDRVLQSGRFILGPEVEAFEREAAAYLGVRDAIGVANGTDALVLTLDALEIGQGDEVLCPSFTFFASAEAIARVGATPVFCDIDPVTLNLDPADAAQAFGARRGEQRVGAFGAASTFSFFPTKNLFALGDGGLVATGDPGTAERVRLLRHHGSRDKERFAAVGYNSRLDALQAAVLRLFLQHVDEWNDARREAAARYEALGLGELCELPADEPGHVYHMYVVRSPQRDRIQERLRAADIGCAAYYTTPLHLQPVFDPLAGGRGSLPETERAARETLALPLWPGITAEQQEQVVEAVRSAVGVKAA